jgi:hypothetical protein
MKPKSRKEDLVVQEANGEVLIYDLRSDKAFCLNETSALIWNACDGSKDVHEIRIDVSKKLKKDAGDDLVWLALDQLKEQKLLSADAASESPLNGLSRREVIKKIGLTTAIALPVVFSLVAPKSVLAQTTCTPVTGGCVCAAGSGPNGQLCTSVTTPCANTACRCFKANNSGGAGSGNCVP